MKFLRNILGMLVTSPFSFSCNVFTSSETEIVILETFNLLSANAFNLVGSKMLSLGKEWQNFWLVQIERICRWQNKCDQKIEISISKIENIVVKGENAGYQHFPLPP